MAVFLIFVGIGVLANLYILYCVTGECRKCRHNSDVVERIPFDSPTRINERRERSLTPWPERSA
jgi:hypothetical protein